MEKRTLKNNTVCALYESRACAVLNMRSCADCPAARGAEDGDAAETVADYLDLFETLLPDGGTAELFESETCTLCKTAPKGKRSCYAILDFGHAEPRSLRAKRFFGKNEVGFMMPLQFACCKACRRRFLIAEYVPLLVPLLLTAIVLPFLVNPHLTEKLRGAAAWLPAALVILSVGGGYLVGKLWQSALIKRYESVMYLDLLSHPKALSLKEKGWFPLLSEKRPMPVFSKKRIAYGLGNAESEVYSRKNPENGEIVD